MTTTGENKTGAAETIVSNLVGIWVIGIGAAVLAGWAYDIEALKSIAPSWVAMAPVTAVVFVLLGLALLILASKQPSPWLFRFAYAVLGFVALLELLTLAEYLFGWNPGFDTLLFHDAVRSYATAFPGRMAPGTLSDLSLLTLALFQIKAKQPWRIGIALLLAAGAGLHSGLYLLIYLYDLSALYVTSSHTQMAFHTTLSLFLLSVGVLQAIPSRNLMLSIIGDGLANAFLRRLLAVGVVIVVLGGWVDLHGYTLDIAEPVTVVALGVLIVIVVFVLLVGLGARFFNRMELALKQSEARYSLVITAMSEGLVLFSSDGVIQACNPAAERIVGLTVDQMRGLTLVDPRWNAINEDGSPCPGEMHPSAITLKTGKPVSNVVIGTHRPDGTIYWSLVNSRPIFDADGQTLAYAVVSFADITELKHAQTELAHLAAIVTYSNDAIVSETEDGIIASWNTGAEKIYGYSAAEVMGKSVTILLPPNQTDDDKYFRQRLIAGEIVQHYDTTRLRKDGTPFPVSITLSALKDQQGHVTGIAKIAQDISVRKQAELQLRQSEALLQTAQRIAHIGNWSWDLHSNQLTWSDEMYHIYGIDKATFSGDLNEVVERAVHPEDRALLESANAAFIKQKVSHPLEYRVMWPDGAVRVVWCGASESLFDNENQPTVVTGVVQDITERKQAEEKLRRYSQRLEATNRLARAITSDLDLDRLYESFVKELRALLAIDRTAIVLLNKAGDQWQIIRQWTNYQPSFVVDEWYPLHDTVVEFVVNSAAPFIEDEIGEHSSWPETAILRREGIHTRLLQPLIIHGQVVGLLSVSSRRPAAFSTDDQAIVAAIAEQLATAIFGTRLYEEVHRYAAELERRVLERTVQLEAANKELEAFSYSVSHDLRAPLRTIDGFSRIILRDYAAQLPAAAQQQLQRVRDGAQQMGKLIDDLLAFSRMGRQSINLHSVSLLDIVHNVLAELESERENRQVELTIGALPTWQADPVLLKQVFVNLIANALKFSGRCAVARIEVGCTQIDGEEVVYVKDNGAGFDMAYADKLFGIFQRLHSADEFPGTGVGLAIVQRIIHRHGGRIWATAEVDKGATFYFTLKGGATHE